jgi:hypothetical protein
VTVVDLLEDDLDEPSLAPVSSQDGDDTVLEMRPFQVVTLRFRRSLGEHSPLVESVVG